MIGHIIMAFIVWELCVWMNAFFALIDRITLSSIDYDHGRYDE
tara:strand:- start:470 stop:598 length:129 start_codon:yes stop_codon:yes gene_type:complete